MAAADLDNTTWNLTSYFDGTTLHSLPADAEVTLTFQGDAAGGKSACNRYRCSVTITDDTLTFGPGVATKMACPPPLMQIEDRYLRTLESVAAWQLADDTLTLRDSAGQAVLVFARG